MVKLDGESLERVTFGHVAFHSVLKVLVANVCHRAAALDFVRPQRGRQNERELVVPFAAESEFLSYETGYSGKVETMHHVNFVSIFYCEVLFGGKKTEKLKRGYHANFPYYSAFTSIYAKYFRFYLKSTILRSLFKVFYSVMPNAEL